MSGAEKTDRAKENIDDRFKDEVRYALQKKFKAEKRTFQFSVENIELQFLALKHEFSFLDKVFVEFQIGGIFHELETAVQVDLDQNTPKKKISDVISNIKSIFVIKDAAKVSQTRYYHKINGLDKLTTEDPVKFHRINNFSGEWTGEYEKLSKEYLIVKVWAVLLMGPNLLIGTGKVPLSDVADGQTYRQLIIYDGNEFSNARNKSAICRCYFTFILEERFDWKLEFSEWELRYVPKEKKSCLTSCCPPSRYSSLHLRINGSKDIARYRHCCDFGRAAIEDVYWNIRNRLAFLWLYHESTTHGGQPCYVLTSNNNHSSSVGSKRTSSVVFKGTRSELEDKTLMISIFEDSALCCFCTTCWACRSCSVCHILRRGDVVVQSTVPIQGRLDYGYIVIPEIDYMKSSGFFMEAAEPCKAFLKGSVSNLGKFPKFRQEGNLNIKSHNKAGKLWIRVGKVRGLHSLTHYRESLSPSVTLDWIYRRKYSKVIKDSNHPNFREWFAFQLPSKVIKRGGWIDSFIELKVWDSEKFDKNPLGHCRIKVRDLLIDRERMRIESHNRISEMKRVYEKTVKLHVPVNTFMGGAGRAEGGEKKEHNQRSVEIMAYFVGAKTSLIEKALKAEDSTKTGGEDETQSGASAKNNRGEGPTSRRKKKKKKKAAIALIPPKKRQDSEDVKRLKRMLKSWDLSLITVIRRLKRFRMERDRHFSFVGIDKFSGGTYLLNTFVSRVCPPKSLRHPSDVLHFVYSLQHLNQDNIEARKYLDDSLRHENTLSTTMVWADPWYVLENRKGSYGDKSVLLCSFLIAMKMNAFVCVGYVYDRIQKSPIPHQWVMTIEDDVEAGGAEEEDAGAAAMAKDAGGEKASIIRFWETSNGRTYQFRDNEIIEFHSKKTKNTRGGGGGGGGGGEQPKGNNSRIDDKEDEDIIRDNLLLYQRKEEIQRQGTDADYIPEEDDGEVMANGALAASKLQSKHYLKRENLKFQQMIQRRIRRKDTQRGRSSNDDDDDDDDNEEKDRRRRKERSQTPYISIDIIFNQEDIWANQQPPNPEIIGYDLKRSELWSPMLSEFYFHREGTSKARIRKAKAEREAIREFYPLQFFDAKPSAEHRIQVSEKRILEMLKLAIKTYRESLKLKTVFRKYFSKRPNLSSEEFIGVRLAEEIKIGQRDKSLVDKEKVQLQKKFEKDTRGSNDDNKQDEVMWFDIGPEAKEYVARDIVAMRKRWQESVCYSVPRGVKIKEKMFYFKSLENKLVAETVIKEAKGLLGISYPSTKFALGCKISRLPAEVDTASLLLLVTYKPSEAAAPSAADTSS